ncbi:MAG TPA: TonB-dependent receptor [Alphaproteobacteria bacterium]|nr:TonB-dependent receptor [Alphaproteobacteria bacterium]
MNTNKLVRLLLTVTFLVSAVLPAQAQASGSITGTVCNAGGAAIAGASVNLRPERGAAVRTDAHGRFTIANVPAGTYDITITKGGFVPYTYGGLVVPATAPLAITLAAATLDTLKQIATVHTSAGAAFNTSATAIQTLSQQTFVDQGQLQIGHVLDQIPGVVSARPNSADAASPGSITSPNLRGALDYEKSTLIDGHPLINGARGDYPTMLVNSLLFSDVEVVKGPTAYANEINYGIGGTLNFVTGAPSLTPQGALVAGFDNQSGSFGELRLSDTLFNGKLGYLVALVRSGTDGPLNEYPAYVTLPAGSKVNGTAISGATTSSTAPAGYSGPYPVPGSLKSSNPAAAYTTLVACCQHVTSTYQSNGELAKLAYHFSNVTTLTAGYIGIQGQYDGPSSSLTQLYSTFTPGLAYDATGTPFTNGGQFLLSNATTLPDQRLYDNEPMFEAEMRSGVGADTVLARYYSAVLERATYSDSTDPAAAYTLPLQLYGTAKLGAATSSFNGQSEEVTIPAASAYVNSMGDHDYLHGSSIEYEHPFESEDFISFAYDADTMLTDSYKVAPNTGATQYSIAPGTRQDMDNYLVRAVLQLGDKAQLTLANYYNTYRTTFTPVSPSATAFVFQTTTSTHDDPRLGFVYRPSTDVAVRFSAGSSIAPAYPSLVDNNTTTPAELGAPTSGAYTISQNSGTLKPETSFAYDLGTDARLPGGNILSVDTYLTNIWNQFATSVSDTGTTYTYQGVAYPVYVSTNENLAQSRYEGVEVGLRRDPPVGYGYTFAGDLARAYAYNISGNFYLTAAGAYTTNLAVIPGTNYYGNGSGYNGISNKSEAYSMGYAAIHRRGSWGQFAELGLTYYGSNNTFNIPAYVVGHATYRQPIAKDTAIQVSADNLFGSNALKYVLYGANSAAIPAPLINGQVGLRGDVPYGPTTLRVMLVRKYGAAP